MAFKQIQLDNQLITIYKRKGSRSLRLSVSSSGAIRVTIPAWAPYTAGIEFAKARSSWIQSQKQPSKILRDGQAIGKAHHLRFVSRTDIKRSFSKITGTEITVNLPPNIAQSQISAQSLAQKASIRALKSQAEGLLPQRLAHLAISHGYNYSTVSVKQLKSRWGSCDQHQNIILNLFLMQLPWDHIDYVLRHELVHTKVLRHGPDFWAEFERILPNAKQFRKSIKLHQPTLI